MKRDNPEKDLHLSHNCNDCNKKKQIFKPAAAYWNMIEDTSAASTKETIKIRIPYGKSENISSKLFWTEHKIVDGYEIYVS